MSIDLRQIECGVVVPVKAMPGSRRTEVRGIHAGMLKLSVTQSAEKGKANRAILEFLADQLQVPRNRLELISGTTRDEKKILVRDGELTQLSEFLGKLANKK